MIVPYNTIQYNTDKWAYVVIDASFSLLVINVCWNMCHLPLHHPSLQNLDRDFLGRIIQADWVGRSMTDSHYICVRLLTLLVCILCGLCLMCEIDAARTIDAAHRNTHSTHQLFWRNSAFTLILVFSYLKRVTYLH